MYKIPPGGGGVYSHPKVYKEYEYKIMRVPMILIAMKVICHIAYCSRDLGKCQSVICRFIPEIPDFITLFRYLFTAVAVILSIYVRVTSLVILTFTFYQINH